MSLAISAADANREFSRVLREVRDGRTYTVTSHGRPVARIIPVTAGDSARSHAHAALLTRLATTRARTAGTVIGRWTRDDLYVRGGESDGSGGNGGNGGDAR